jgi:hypothetical protein
MGDFDITTNNFSLITFSLKNTLIDNDLIIEMQILTLWVLFLSYTKT